MSEQSITLSEFNHKTKQMLEEIIAIAPEGALSDLMFFWLDMEQYQNRAKNHYSFVEIVRSTNSVEEFSNCLEPDWTFGYYWAEFTYCNEKYKIAMFYKDFDHGSGNIHVLPGMVEIFKRGKNQNIPRVYEGIVQDPQGCPKSYKALGGKPFSEEEWIPTSSGSSRDIRMVWNPQSVCVSKLFWVGFPDKSLENSQWCKWSEQSGFYSEQIKRLVRHYSKAKGMYAPLYGWVDEAEKIKTQYKFIYVENEGYFLVFMDLEEKDMHVYDSSQNPTGPNVYDSAKGCWIIHYEES